MSAKNTPAIIHGRLPQMVPSSKNARKAVSKFKSNADEESLSLISDNCGTNSPEVIEINSSRSNSPNLTLNNCKSNSEVSRSDDIETISSCDENSGQPFTATVKDDDKRQVDVKNITIKTEDVTVSGNASDVGKSTSMATGSVHLEAKHSPKSKLLDSVLSKISTAAIADDSSLHQSSSKISCSSDQNEKNSLGRPGGVSDKNSEDSKKSEGIPVENSCDSNSSPAKISEMLTASSSSETSPTSSSRRAPRKQENPLKRLRSDDESPETVSPKIRRRLLADNTDNKLDESVKKSSRYGRVQRKRSMGPDMELLPLVNRHKPKSRDSTPKAPRHQFTPKKVIGTGDFVLRLLEDIVSKLDDPTPGDLFWSRIPGHPYWPCMISLDPIKGMYRKELSNRNKRGPIFHVQYFGKGTQRGWTEPNGIIPFRGQRHFERLLHDLTEKTPDGPDQDFIAFHFKVNPKRLPSLNIAIEEAEEAFGMSRDQRISELTFEYKLSYGKTIIPVKEGLSSKETAKKELKRKVGRPRKSPSDVVSTSQELPSTSSITSKIIASSSAKVVTSPGGSSLTHTKKGRGRPRKDSGGSADITKHSPKKSPSNITQVSKRSDVVKKQNTPSNSLPNSRSETKKTLGIRLNTPNVCSPKLKTKSNENTSKITSYFKSSPKAQKNEKPVETVTVVKKELNLELSGSVISTPAEPGRNKSDTTLVNIKTEKVSPVKQAKQGMQEKVDRQTESSFNIDPLKIKKTGFMSAKSSPAKNSVSSLLLDGQDSSAKSFTDNEKSASLADKSDLTADKGISVKNENLQSLDVTNENASDESDGLEVLFVNISPKKKKRRKKKIEMTISSEKLDEQDCFEDTSVDKNIEMTISSEKLDEQDCFEGTSEDPCHLFDESLEKNDEPFLVLHKLEDDKGIESASNGDETALVLSEDSADDSDLQTQTASRLNKLNELQDLNTVANASPRRSSRGRKPKTPPEDFIQSNRKKSLLPNKSSRKENVVRALDMDCEKTIAPVSAMRKTQRSCAMSRKETVVDTDSDFLPDDEADENLSPSKRPKNSQKTKGDYSAFLDKHRVQYRKQYPSFSDKELEEYMIHEWDNLSENIKNTYITHFSNSAAKKPLSPALPHTQRKPASFVDKSDLSGKSSEEADTESEETDSTCSAQGQDGVCTKCEKPGELINCAGECNQLFHLHCTSKNKGVLCDECHSDNHSCFQCKSKEGQVVKCPLASCGKFYHPTCLSAITSESKLDIKSCNVIKSCPLHACLTCNISNPKGVSSRRSRLKRCVRCPVAYHSGDGCLAAGCLSLSRNSIVCPNHFAPDKGNRYHTHVSVNWCFTCSMGGQLICCESCPAAYHAECLELETPEGSFFCEDCSSGKHPCYGDIVWVKLGSYRWWPAEICQAKNVPQNIQNLPHRIGQFPVQFFGSHDYFWIHRGRVFLFQEGDNGSKRETSRHLAKVFQKAVAEATEAFQKLSSAKAARETQCKSKKPPPYKYIKVNRPVGKVQLYTVDESKLASCDCDPSDPNPCGMDSQCLNRVMMIECHPAVCRAKEACQNQIFIKRQNAPAKPVLGEGRGWGLCATADIKKGAFVAEYVGELIDEEECQQRLQQKQKDNDHNFYFLTLDKDRIIDAGPKGNLSRFMNHSCQPNCESQKWTVNGDTRVGLFALYDIPAGSELTFNYNLDCYGNEKSKCACGSDNCSGFIGVRPKTLAAIVQERKAKETKENGKKHRRNKAQQNPKHEDECFRCLEGGELMMCDRKGCTKAYHLNCLNLDKPPYGRWECPWHHCDQCGRTATILCSQCPNSYCKEHGTETNIINMDDTFLVCKEHWEHVSDDDGDQELVIDV